MNRVALLLGVDVTKVDDWNNLTAPKNDVEKLSKILTANELGAFNKAHQIVSESSESSVKRKIHEIAQESQTDALDLFLFYFSGHGDVSLDTGQLHLVCHESTAAFVDTLPFDNVVEQLKKINSTYKVIVLDCCYSANGARAIRGVRTAGAAATKNQGFAFLCAADCSSQTKEDPINEISLFTQVIIEGISTGRADVDGNRKITLTNLHKYAEANLSSSDAKPYLVSDDGDNIILALVPKESQQEITSELPVHEVQVFRNWDPAVVWDGIRMASRSVDVFQTWLPGGQAEVARYGSPKSAVDYRVLLIDEKSTFVQMRIKNRQDFAFTVGDASNEYSKVQTRVADCQTLLNERGFTGIRKYDSFAPGPVYFIDDKVFYGLYLPQVDASLAPMHVIDRSSELGCNFKQLFDEVWENKSSNLAPKTVKPSLEFGDNLLRNRLQQLETDVAWLQYPLNQSIQTKNGQIPNVKVLNGIPLEAICQWISDASARVYFFTPWIENAERIQLALKSSNARSKKAIVSIADGQFATLRSSIIPSFSTSDMNKLITRTLQCMEPLEDVWLKVYDDFFMPGPVIVIDNRLIYGVFMTQETILGGPLHITNTNNDVAEYFLEAFEIAWNLL